MSSIDWARLSALYDEGAALPPEQRTGWLQQQAEPLRERLARMLAKLDQTTGGGTLNALRDSVAAALPAAPALQPGEQLGVWQLRAPLGEGGMGQVWRARRADGLYEAEAAIKLLRADLGGAELAARFARERRLLGRLQHPGIARLLDAGLDPVHGAFLVLELVEGVPLTLAARGLNVAARVRLLVQVAQAVQAAHAQLIVHRDLKPANVLVDAQGVPKLLDFGIATLLDDEGGGELTRLAGNRLTPAYAAPEQVAGGDVGTTTDVFALGVMLYELLTGALPQGPHATTRVQLEHALLHQAPLRFAEQLALPERSEGPGRPPDAKAALGDLEAVCAKALRKRPGDRYPSVGALIADLERWLGDLPVSVRREDWQHRTRLWLRRHRALALGGTLLLLTLAGGLGASLWQRQRALQAAREADLVSNYLTELLEAASPDQHGNRPPTVLELLESKRAELPQRFASEPAVKDRVLRTLVNTYLGLNRFDIALPLAEQRVALTRAWGLDDPRHDDARIALARLHTALGNGEPVIALLEELLPVYLRRHGPDHGETTTVRQQLALAYARAGRFEASAQLLAEEEASMRRRPGDAFLRAFHANYTHVLSTQQGRLSEAEAQLLAAQPTFALASPRHQRYARVMERNLAVAQWRMLRDDAERASARTEELAARADALLGRGNNLVGSLRAALATHLQALGQPGPALAQLQRAEADAEAAGVNFPLPRLGRQVALLAARVRAGEPVRAPLLTAAQEALQSLDAQPALGGTHRAEALLELGTVALGAGPAGQGLAEALLQRLDALALRPYWHSRSERLRAALAGQRGEARAAVAAARRATESIERLPEVQGIATWATWLDLARHLHAAGEDTSAALQQAAARRPAPLDTALAGRPHPLDRWRPGHPWPAGF